MRKSCIIFHISSLPSEYGIGKMGRHAFEFVDFLKSANVRCWQILPLSPTSYGDSPYQSLSVNAGNPYFIDFEILENEGLLEHSEFAEFSWGNDSNKIDYELLYSLCFNILKMAYSRFKPANFPEFRKFCAENSFWLDEYALFMSLKFANDSKAWYNWENGIAMHYTKSVIKERKAHKSNIEFFKFIQFQFFRQWKSLKIYANDNGIEIVGDIPIYCALDSVESWSDYNLFWVDSKHRPVRVAGCPPDDFSSKGQLWGNPLYDWDYHKKTGYKWWIQRIKSAFEIYDIVRIDHFRGFESYYTIPFGNEDATEGDWKKGPNTEFFNTVEEQLGRLNIIVEDLGWITPEVRLMLNKCGYPGMKVLQFGFSDSKNEHLPHNFTTTNCYVYTGTHDNETLNGWIEMMDEKALEFTKKYLNVNNKSEIPSAVIRAAWGSIADVAVAQMQDFLDSPREARMNTPSTIGRNWQFRTKTEDFTPELAKKIKTLNKIYNR